jgi:hypothetical protein
MTMKNIARTACPLLRDISHEREQSEHQCRIEALVGTSRETFAESMTNNSMLESISPERTFN